MVGAWRGLETCLCVCEDGVNVVVGGHDDGSSRLRRREDVYLVGQRLVSSIRWRLYLQSI
jgi:hypothetical protein